jgi:shikimate kinase / 3-dehydroquinate synthase
MMRISIAGPPGIGKSSVSKVFAQHYGVRSSDLDERIQDRTGKTVPDILNNEGESAFRAYETEALQMLDQDIAVLALGGGSLTHGPSRQAARKRGPLFALVADVETIRNRLQRSTVDRPLLRADTGDEDRLQTLLDARKKTYASVDIMIDAQATPEDIAQEIFHRAQDTFVLHASVGQRESRIIVGSDLSDAVRGALLNLEPGRIVVAVTDAGIPKQRRDAILDPIREIVPIHEIVGEGGEAVKSWEFLGRALEQSIEAGAGRQSVVIGLGGGATCDVAGLLAALLGRGAGLIMVPTTVVSQVDASVGGKTAVNMAHGRNLVGTFYPASDVIVDTNFLDSLDEAEYRSGLSEVLKMGIISDPELFNTVVSTPRLSAEIVARTIRHKAKIVAGDPFEKADRKKLNLGHTLAHALESASHFQMRHGDAVSIGLAAIARLCCARNWLAASERDTIIEGLSRVKLPVFAPPALIHSCGRHIGKDKKSDSRYVDLIIVRKLGETEVMRVELQNIVADLVHFGGTK